MAAASHFPPVDDLLDDYTSPILKGEGRKRKKVWAKNVNKKLKYSGAGVKSYISCNNHDNHRCQASTLTDKDIQDCFDKLHRHTTKVAQDHFIALYIKVAKPKRRRPSTSINKRAPRTMAYKCYIRTKSGAHVPVCNKTFQSIMGVTKKRVYLIAKYYHEKGTHRPERRGGSRQKPKDVEIENSINTWIGKDKARVSHYGRNKSKRMYLPPELNVIKMWKAWKADRQQNDQNIASLSKFKAIFYRNFNIAFGNPRCDVCSYCETQKMKIKSAKTDNDKVHDRTALKLHKLRARRFYDMLKQENEDEIKVVFDIQQNQPIPKLSVGEVFYARQVWIYNLTFIRHSVSSKQIPENVFIYTWLETESGRGANEVSSALIDCLTKLEQILVNEHGPNKKFKLVLYSDSCVSQNKNTIVISCLKNFQMKSDMFTEIQHVFPIRGHSFLPADRLFGRIEKQLRKKEMILSPNAYCKIFSEHGQVMALGKDWHVRDYATVTKQILKARLPFKLNEQRVITFKSESLGVQNVYSTEPDCVASLLKKGKSYDMMDTAERLPLKSRVKPEKLKDVVKLMKYFDIPEDGKSFYRTLVNAHNKCDANVDIDEDEVDVYEDTEPFL